MPTIRYLTHPEVDIDPGIAVSDWGLSDKGRARIAAAIGAGVFAGVEHIVSSAERKALEAAHPIAQALRLRPDIRPGMHENDRSATGYLAAAEFEAAADAFFASPDASFQGWERAADAQHRIRREAEAALASRGGDVLFVGHGAVGTLLWCEWRRRAIARAEDQFPGGGCIWAVERRGRAPIHSWRRLEDL